MSLLYVGQMLIFFLLMEQQKVVERCEGLVADRGSPSVVITLIFSLAVSQSEFGKNVTLRVAAGKCYLYTINIRLDIYLK